MMSFIDPSNPSPLRSPSRPITACFGGGGSFGMGFEMGVVTALVERGIPVDKGPMLGTSAGAWTAASLATGMTYDQLVDASNHPGRTREKVRVIDITREVFADHRDDRVTGMAMQLPFAVRTALSGERYALADIVAASSSLPRVTEPHRIDGRRYIDAGVIRSASADRAKSARVLVVVTPIARRVLGPFGRMYERITRYEIERWRFRAGGDVLFVRPTRQIVELIEDRGVAGILDVDAGRRAYEPAYELGLRCAERFRARHPAAAEELAAIS